VDNLLGGLSKPLDTHGRLGSRPRTFGRKFISSEKQSIISEIHEVSTPIGQLVRPCASEPRDPKLESPSGAYFAEIVKHEKIERNQEFLLN